MKAILIDDEQQSMEILEHQLKKISNIIVIGKFTHFDIEQHGKLLYNVDIIFSGTKMYRINGLKLAEDLIKVNPSLAIVFVTSFIQYAIDAFELNAVDYIIKPVSISRLQKSLKRIESKINVEADMPLPERSGLFISVCNDLSLQLSDGKPMRIKWRTEKVKELFSYLLLHSGNIIHKSLLVEKIWPDHDFHRAYKHLYNTIYHIRKAIMRFPNHLSVKNVGNGYVLETTNVKVDLIEWEDKITHVPPIDKNTIKYCEKHMELYTGSYLSEHDYLWAVAERIRLDKLWIKIARQIADFYYHKGQLNRSEEWYLKICKKTPEDEDTNFALMTIYSKLGLGILVHYQYNQFAKSLDELDLSIPAPIQNWYNNLYGGKII